MSTTRLSLPLKSNANPLHEYLYPAGGVLARWHFGTNGYIGHMGWSHNYPFAYVSEPGEMEHTEQEQINLREFIGKEGFVLVDDFDGPVQFEQFRSQLLRAFPDRNLIPVPWDHEHRTQVWERFASDPDWAVLRTRHNVPLNAPQVFYMSATDYSDLKYVSDSCEQHSKLISHSQHHSFLQRLHHAGVVARLVLESQCQVLRPCLPDAHGPDQCSHTVVSAKGRNQAI